MRKKDVWLPLVLILLATLSTVKIAYATTTIYIDPVTSTAQPGETFSININIADVDDLYAWGFRLQWDPLVLNVTEVVEGAFLQVHPEGTLFVKPFNNTAGYVDIGCTTAGDYPGVSGSGTLATVTFLAKAVGESALNMSGAELYDHFLNLIPAAIQKGHFTNLPDVHDIAVTDVTASPTLVAAGESVTINATVENEGDFTETFNVTAYYDDNIISTQTGIYLVENSNTILTFTWNTTGMTSGSYTIRVEASVVEMETDTEDNTFTDDTVQIAGHDIAILNINAAKTTVTAGETVPISVTVKNEGTFAETFNVTAYYDGNIISTQTVTNLAPGSMQTLDFSWDTTGVPGEHYLAKAVASIILGETDTDDNTLIAPWFNSVLVESSGDGGFPTDIVLYVVIAVVVVAGVAWFAYRRKKT